MSLKWDKCILTFLQSLLRLKKHVQRVLTIGDVWSSTAFNTDLPPKSYLEYSSLTNWEVHFYSHEAILNLQWMNDIIPSSTQNVAKWPSRSTAVHLLTVRFLLSCGRRLCSKARVDNKAWNDSVAIVKLYH